MRNKGFVDLQVNGWMGIDFSGPDLSLRNIGRVTRDLVDRGTIAYCPTLITSHYDTYRKNLPLFAEAMRDPDIGPHLLGLHLEGPFISPKNGARGAHPRRFVKKPSLADFDTFQEWAEGTIRMVTLDPSQPRAPALIRHLHSRNIIVSMGHHLAPIPALEEGLEAGITCATHVGNGIPNTIPRHDNPIWWQLARDGLTGTFITDGHHLPAPFIKVALRAKTIDQFVVVSDASPLAGMPPGEYNVFGMTVQIEPSGRIYAPASGSLVGSHSTMLDCMNHLAGLDIMTEPELWKAGLHNPLNVLGLSPDDIKHIPGPAVTFDGRAFTITV